MMYSTAVGLLLLALVPPPVTESASGRLFSSLSLEHRLRRTEVDGVRRDHRRRTPARLYCSIAGTVRGPGAAQAVVVLVGGNVAVRTIANDQGRFRFPRVRAAAHVLFVEVNGQLAERWVDLRGKAISLQGVDLNLLAPPSPR
jgi:hypothetical protein